VDAAVGLGLNGINCFIVSAPGATPADVTVAVPGFALYVTSPNLTGTIGNVTMGASSAFLGYNLNVGAIAVGDFTAVDGFNLSAQSVTSTAATSGTITFKGPYSVVGDINAPLCDLTVSDGAQLNAGTVIAKTLHLQDGDYTSVDTTLTDAAVMKNSTLGGATSFTVGGTVDMEGMEIQGAVPFTNGGAVEFRMDSYSKYWFNRFASTLSNPGLLVITELTFTQTVTHDVGALAVGGNTVSIPVPGAKTGMGVVVNPDPLLSDSIALVQQHVSAANVVDVVFYNLSGAPISPGSQNYIVTLSAQ
jgi:hypothetical protein